MPDPNAGPFQNHQLEAIREFSKEALVTTFLDGVVTEWNPAAERLFGYRPDEVIGKSFTITIPQEDRARELEILQGVSRGERTLDFETRRIRKDGALIQISATYTPLRDQTNKVVAALIIAVDMMERRRLEEAERDRLFLSAIVSSAEDAIVSKNLDGVVTSWNKGAERIFGYSAAEMIGMPISILIPTDHPNEEPQILERIRRGERIEHYETQRRRKDGKIIEVSVTISPIRDRIGRIVGASKIARDVTEQRRWQKAEVAESFLGALVESAEDAIISKNLEGIVTNWNPAAEKLFGYTAAEMLGKSLTILVPTDHPDEENQILKRIRRGERIEHFETQRRCKDGKIVEVAQTISPVRDNLGRVIGVSNITRDITNQRRGELRERDALRQAQDARRQAEEANRAKDEFLAMVSHELRTPMTAILGWSRMLANGKLDKDGERRAVETIDRNARSQAQLIEDLLDISRIVSGRLRIEFKVVDMAVIIAAAVEAARPAAEARQIRIQTTLSSVAGPIRGDAERLQQVIWNLLTNAIKFTPRNGHVRIELDRVESQVELRIVDDGIGIKQEFVRFLFERFSQADSSITRSGGGLGIGLAIVKSLVELHGGVVSAFSDGEGKGSTFTVKLPVSAVRQEQRYSLPHPEVPQLAMTNHEALVGLKILIVDDEPDTCDLLRFILNKGGAIIETAGSADAALRIYDEFQPDILISDIGLPRVDGYELIRILREERHSGIPAVALTAMARIDDRLKALSAGFQMHIPKPVEPTELVSVVESLVGLVNRRPTGESR